MPHDAPGRLGGEHRDGLWIDHARLAQVAGADRAAGLLVADEVQHDAAVAEQAEIAHGDSAVEHAHEAALHVRGTAPDDAAVGPLRLELLTPLRRDDVEVAVEVERSPAAPASRERCTVSSRRPCRELDELGREIEPTIASRRTARTPPARARRVLGVDRNEPSSRPAISSARASSQAHRWVPPDGPGGGSEPSTAGL